ncbi:VOC family protein [Actinobacteria bacterium YIM 96077]|uniref:VOC family protein n=1 Tax=Phytoactinopolyspora halophila TaxID=1981511 RepID=A0A329QR24_9ACTN|nr:VOC family protein [Phytoactinopolyspora halophila]AYY14265.1 VOC family protein [Actinobacteria bacterium YIM 96077]RAW14807.1 VOC family protein [Phytoactinopolyspora halophila]
MRRVGYVIWFVASLERSVAFYRDVLGLEVRLEGDGYVEFTMENVKFSLFDRAKLPELIGRPGGQPPCGEIAFVVDDVDGEAARLSEAGAQVLSGPVDRPWGQRTLHIADPDGNVVELAQNLDRRGWALAGRWRLRTVRA